MTRDDSGLNLATAWETVAGAVPDSPALLHGTTERSWAEFEQRSARLARALTDFGVRPDSKVAFYLFNGPEYLEGQFAAFKQRAVPVNVNYRYLEAELEYLLDNSDARVVLFDSTLAERIARVRSALPLLKGLIQVGEGELLDGAVRYEDAISRSEPASPIERATEDLWLLYTGGTTGMPKGVMWPHGSLVEAMAPTFKPVRVDPPRSPEEVTRAVGLFEERGLVQRLLPAAPLMHGTANISSMMALTSGGSVVTLSGHHFEPDELWRNVEDRQVTHLTIVGDAFAKPMLEALETAEAAGRPYDLSSLVMITSSGVMWSAPVKEALLQRHDMVLADLLGSSEGLGFGSAVAKRGRTRATGRFRLGERAKVFTEDGRAVEPGSGQVGVLAVGGPIPLGYYKDPDKTAETFREFEGRRWSVPGDFATVEADGSITLLGRGSVSINTGGEKVYPEEVEEVLKTHTAVRDCNVVGIPDEKWGQAVSAVVSLRDGARVTPDELVAHVHRTLSGYKCPKHVVIVDHVQRAPNGKADYKWAAEVARSR